MPTTATDWERVFTQWAQPPGQAEQERIDRTTKAIRTAIARSEKLKRRTITVFDQGSYRNRVNVRQDSDVDVGVMCSDVFLSQYPPGKTRADFGFAAAGYTFAQFKDELEEALVAYFGRSVVTRGNKAFDIKAKASHVEADVVPLFEFRQYFESNNYRAGVALIPDDGSRIENYPERLLNDWPSTPLHYENGVSKNTDTQRRFKGMVRIIKSLRNTMDEAGVAEAKPVPGYLIECLVWNTPNSVLLEDDDIISRVRWTLAWIGRQTVNDDACRGWTEVDAIKYLFHASQPWTRQQAHAFALAAITFIDEN